MFSYKTDRQSGNIVVYLLVALALFGGLTVMMMRQDEQGDGQSLSDEQLAINSNAIVGFAATAQNVVDQMIIAGSNTDELDFINPASAGFEDPPHIHKLFHPSGGGLSYPSFNDSIFTGADSDPSPGWYIGVFENVEWTPTTAEDVIMTAHQISQPLCAAINKKITGNTSIPALAGTGLIETYLIDTAEHGEGNAELDETVCEDCAGQASLCVSNTGATKWSYYSIIGAQ